MNHVLLVDAVKDQCTELYKETNLCAANCRYDGSSVIMQYGMAANNDSNT